MNFYIPMKYVVSISEPLFEETRHNEFKNSVQRKIGFKFFYDMSDHNEKKQC